MDPVLAGTYVTGAANILKITWDEAHHIMERAVARGLARRPHAVPKQLGIDEKSLAKGQRYATMVCDLENGHVIELAEDRTKESLLRCLGRYSINDLAGVEAIAMDMWEPYVLQVRAVVDDADDKIVFDRFH
ncbi:MAG: transposase, partial [Frankia sp.]|nr:transposase [Frankia sp.]